VQACAQFGHWGGGLREGGAGLDLHNSESQRPGGFWGNCFWCYDMESAVYLMVFIVWGLQHC
jgi:hypothetical protein